MLLKPHIYWLPGPWLGKLSILARPRPGDWLSDEVGGWRAASVHVVVSLLCDLEEIELGLTEEADVVQRNGLRFISFPIEDYAVPASEDTLRGLLTELDGLLTQGKNVGIHCRGGIGRSSLVAACLLVNSGLTVQESFQLITKSRGVTVPDTLDQREWVSDFARVSPSASR